ncbi:glutathione hydrolase-like YwrD proenzyme [Abditibacteriota bacterium]|nr:glutathione hydrolase-like YwrD proenzyme [Abditibacteriota bacterium]
MSDFRWDFPYSSRRMPVFARNVVATSQPLAAQAGLQMMARGGNAIDAAVATAIALTIVEPTSNGIGSDSFAQVWDGEQLHGLNASGRSPKAWNLERFSGRETMPLRGWDTVTVPGAVSGWVALSERFGALPFADLFEPAIRYAREGFPVSPYTAQSWEMASAHYADFPEWTRTFCPQGHAPRVGEIFACEEQAQTLELIAQTRGEAFYRGVLAERMTANARAEGGALTLADLDEHRCDWVDPIGLNYHGYTLHEIPPNGQGLAALIALGILEYTDIADCALDSADWLHLQIEAMKLAFADAHRHLADPRYMEVPTSSFLLPAYLQERARLIARHEARDPQYGIPPYGGTVYLTTADAQGRMVSLIQSNYHGFGSGVVVPGTGISLQNRGYGFTLEAGHPNVVAGGKRPFHTIIPAFVTKDGAPFLSFGVMGGPMQPQGHVQMMLRVVGEGQNPQAACDAPRWCVLREREVSLEAGFDEAVVAELRARGHQLVETKQWGFGGAQLICKQDDAYCAASDSRKDGQAVGF